jgi:hypothetical protein
MTTRRIFAAPSTMRLLLGTLLALASVCVHAQSGPIATQNLFFDQASGAHQGNYLDAQTGLIYVDNATMEPGGKADELAMVGLVGDTSRVGAPRVDYHLDSDISLIKYLSNSYDTQPFGYADGDAELKLVPGLFSWVGRATYTQAVLDPTQPATPDNLENLTYLTTGPKFNFRPTLRTTISVSGVYSYVVTGSKSPEYVDIDNHRIGGDVKFSRAFTNTFTGYLNGSYDRVQFTNTLDNSDFNQENYALGVTFGDSRTAIEANVGYTELQIFPAPTQTEVTNTNPSGTTWLLNISRLISPTQRLSLHTSKQITDAANIFRLNLDQPVPVTQQDQTLTEQPYTHRDYGGSWRLEGTKSTLQISGLVATDRYEITPTSNRDSDILNGFFTRQLNRSFIWELGVAYEKDKYNSSSGTTRTTTGITTLRWRVGPRLGLRFIYAHSNISQDNVSQNQVGLTVSYALTEAAEAKDTLLMPMTPNSPAMQPRLQ